MNYFVEGLQGAGKSTLVGRLAKELPGYQVFREGDYNPVELAWCGYLTDGQYEELLRKYAALREEITANTHEERDYQSRMQGDKNGDNTDSGAQRATEPYALRHIITYTRILTDIPGFHKDLEQYEIYNGRVAKEDFEQIILSRYANWQEDEQIFECSLFQNVVESQILYYEMSDEEILAFYARLKSVLGDRAYKILYLEVKDIAESIRIIRKERVDDQGNEMWFPLMMAYLEECPWSKHHGLKGFEGLVAHLEHRKALELRILREVFPEHAVILKSKDYDLKWRLNLEELPDRIREIVGNLPYELDGIGRTDSQVRIYEEFVLKIERENQSLADMVKVMEWLDGRLPAPKVLCSEVKNGYRYLLMSKVRGRMACDEYYLTRPKELVSLLAKSLKMLWSVDVSECPRIRDLKAELAEARYRVEHGMVDMERVEPTTFGEGGFKDPEDLLNWLESHQPEYEPVFSHGDLCLPNVFFEGGKVSGFIDLGDAGIGDKWRDIALCCRSLRHNMDGTFGKAYEGVNADDLFTMLGIEPNWEKLRYYLLLDELF